MNKLFANAILTTVCVLCNVHVFAKEVEIINIYDAFGEQQQGTTQDHGLSMLVRYKGKTILFDSGTNADILERNSKALGVDLAEVDFAVASHAHLDHTGGFHYLLRVNPQVKIYYPHDTFGASAPISFDIAGKDKNIASMLPVEQRYFRGESTIAEIKTNGVHYKSVIYVENHTQILPGVNLIVTESDNMGYFTKYPGVDLHGRPTGNDGQANFLGLPELSLSLKTASGEILLVGCSHSTVEKIVKESKKVLDSDINLLVGGYHLLPYDEETIAGISERLESNLNVKHVAPAHCTGHLGFHELKKRYGPNYHFFGLGSRLTQ